MQKAKRLEAEIAESLEEMNGHSFTDEKEQLFHAVYSNAVSYFANAENVFQMSREGNSETARYYVTSYLADLYFLYRCRDGGLCDALCRHYFQTGEV